MIDRIIDLIDFDKVNILLEGFNKSTGFVTAILDLEGNVLSKSGWRQICTEFHRVHPESAKKCIESDTILSSRFTKGEEYHFYKCLNGLVDVAVPIIINNVHIANLFSGQFFLEKPDKESFKNQAVKYGFDIKEYLNALDQVPLVSEEQVSHTMEFLLNMTKLISEMTLQKGEQIELNKALKKSEEKYRSIFENVQDVFYQIDPNGIITEISPSIFKMAGYQREDLIGKSLQQFYFDQEERLALMDVLADQDEVWDYEIRMVEKTGQVKYVSLNAHKMTDADNILLGIEGSMRDISERKKFETELIGAKNKAEESDRLKTAFLHNISHEIRTPMNAIIGFTALMSEPDISPENKITFIETIQGSSNQLLSIINDIVDISNIETNLVKLHITEFNLNKSFESLYEQFLPVAKKKNIYLGFKTGLGDDEAIIQTDSTKLIQVISNLINNALKFTSEGQIIFGYSLNGPMLEFFVSDTGIGIPDEQHDMIFNRFYQVENTISRQYEGTGLGLSICKGYVELLGGRIWLTSEHKKGSVFYFTIPNNQINTQNFSEPPEEHSEIPATKKPDTILIAEDDLNSFKLMTNYLANQNFKIIHAINGIEAVETCRSRNDIALVLMDIKMPLLDGYSATRQIREFLPEINIIAQTAFYDDKEKALANGCNDFISKPFTKDHLISKIREQLRKT
jgi:PAS domain S-box-containing protein